jgi:XTP/dITP diphosphohydrolase
MVKPNGFIALSDQITTCKKSEARMKPILLIATQNKGKLKEIRDLLKDLPLELRTPDQISLNLEVNEDGSSYEENAIKKAAAYANTSGLLTLADDSGLEVEALGGQPGVFSARYAQKPGATDADRRRFLLLKLQAYPKPWLAEFKCVVAIHRPGGETIHAEGVCPGEIIPNERGNQGFGYDPIFLVNGTQHTMAELSLDMKNKISHRARAIQTIKPFLMDLLSRSKG